VGSNRARSLLPRGHALTKPPVTQAPARKRRATHGLASRRALGSPVTEMAASNLLRVPLELSCLI